MDDEEVQKVVLYGIYTSYVLHINLFSHIYFTIENTTDVTIRLYGVTVASAVVRSMNHMVHIYVPIVVHMTSYNLFFYMVLHQIRAKFCYMDRYRGM